MRLRVVSGWLAVTVVALAVSCSRSSNHSPVAPSPSGGAMRLEDFAASASSADTSGVRKSGSAPSPNGGPHINATANHSVINGGTLLVTVDADSAFNTVYVFVGGRTLGVIGEFSGTVEGYYEIRLPNTQNSATVLLTFPQEIPLEQFDLQFAVGNVPGSVGPYTTVSANVIRVGTGDVQVTLSWNHDSDVDLHVIDPSGEEVYYGHPQSTSGGTLDLDSNAGCGIDGVRNENITWPTGRAPRGRYTVRVDYWSNCSVSSTNYSVRVNNGGSIQVFEGVFTGPGDGGGATSGRTITTFDRLTGPAAVIASQPEGLAAAPRFFKKLVTQTQGR